MECEAIGADGGGAGSAELRQRDAETFLRVDADAFASAENLNLFGLSFHELLKFRLILKVIDVRWHARQRIAVEGMHRGTHLLKQRRHIELRGFADSAA